MTAEYFDLTISPTGARSGRTIRPVTLNMERKGHWAQASQSTGLWRAAACDAILAARNHRKRWERCRFELLPVYASGNLPDTGSVFPTEKAIVDAAVDMEIIPDDNAWHNAGQLSMPPQRGSFTGMLVRFVRATAHPEHQPRSECGCRDAHERSQMHNELRRRN